MTSNISIVRLRRELRELKSNPLPGFFICPAPKGVGMKDKDMFHWIIGIPGLPGGNWKDCTLRLDMYFKDQYPSKPPKCQFVPPLFHPNIYPSGSVCLSLLNEDIGWSPAVTVRDILLGIQKLLDEVNLADPAQAPAYMMAKNTEDEYKRRVKDIVRRNPSKGFKTRLKESVKRGEFRTSAVLPTEIGQIVTWSTAVVIEGDSIPSFPSPVKPQRQKAKPADDIDVIDISDGSDGLSPTTGGPHRLNSQGGPTLQEPRSGSSPNMSQLIRIETLSSSESSTDHDATKELGIGSRRRGHNTNTLPSKR